MADSRLRAEENVGRVTHLLTRAKELGVMGSLSHGPTATALAYPPRGRVMLLDAVVEQANTRFGSGYLFGGAPDAPPFTGRRATSR
jgi:hypothetical protein